MGQYVPRLVSPVTGAPEAGDTAAISYIFETMVWSTLMFGSLAVLNVYTQVQNLLR